MPYPICPYRPGSTCRFVEHHGEPLCKPYKRLFPTSVQERDNHKQHNGFRCNVFRCKHLDYHRLFSYLLQFFSYLREKGRCLWHGFEPAAKKKTIRNDFLCFQTRYFTFSAEASFTILLFYSGKSVGKLSRTEKLI